MSGSLTNSTNIFVGELWYVSLPDESTISTVKVMHTTEQTVLIRDNTMECGFADKRYAWFDISFVEKVDGSKSNS